MSKFYIGKSGKPTICHAKQGNCPFGSDEEHYKTREEASKALENNYEKIILTSNNKDSSIKNYNEVIKELSEKADALDIYQQQTIEEYENMLYMAAKTIKKKQSDINELLNIVNEAMIYIDQKHNPKLSNGIDKFVSNIKESEKFSYEELENLEEIKLYDDYIEKIYDININDIKDTESASLIHKIRLNDGNFISHKKVSENLYYAKIGNNKTQNSYIYYNEQGLDNPQDMKTVQLYNVKNSDYSPIPKKNIFEGIDDETKNIILSRDVLSKIAGGNEASLRHLRDELMSDPSRAGSKARIRRAVLEIQMSKNILNNETYINKNYKYEIKKPKNEKYYIKLFKSGTVILDERKLEIAKQTKMTKDFKELKRTIIKEGRSGMTEKYNIVKEDKDIEKEKQELDKVLSSEDKDRIKEYTSNSYKQYGARAMGGDRIILAKEHDGKYISNNNLHDLNVSIQKMQELNKEKRNLYRGFVAPQGMTAEEYVKSFKSGDTVTNTKLLSTSTSFSTAMNFTKAYNENIVFVYQTRKGAPVEHFSDNSYENESIIPIGEKMIVVDTAIDSGGRGIVFFTDKE